MKLHRCQQDRQAVQAHIYNSRVHAIQALQPTNTCSYSMQRLLGTTGLVPIETALEALLAYSTMPAWQVRPALFKRL